MAGNAGAIRGYLPNPSIGYIPEILRTRLPGGVLWTDKMHLTTGD